MKKTGILIIAMILTVFCTAAGAEITPGVYTITPYAGGYFYEGNEGLKNTYTVGLRLGYNATENIGMETVFSLTPTKIDYEDGDDVRMWSYGIEGIYHFMPDKKLVPFVAVGLGGIYYDSLGFTERINKFYIDYGGGFKYSITDKVAVRADIRHVMPISETYNDFLFGVGITYAFGTSRRSVASTREDDYYTPPAAPVKAEAPAPAPEPVAAAPAPEPVAPAAPIAVAPAPEPVAPTAPVAAPAPAEAPITVVVEEQKETKSPAEEDIKNLVGKWREAWQSGDMLTYRNCYAPKFAVKGKDLDQWVAYKTKLQKRSKNIKIAIEDLKITLNDADTATAVFTQNYSSSVHRDSGEKILRLVKIDGQWKISDEIM